MITKPAAFRVYGEPAPKGSLAGRCLTHPKIGQKALKAARVVMSEQSNRGRPWRKAIEKAAPLHITERPDRQQPLRIVLLFALTRQPAAAHRRYPAARSSRGIGGDIDKLTRLVLDALESAEVLTDDAQIVTVDARKVYSDDPAWWHPVSDRAGKPGLYCRIEPMTPSEYVAAVAELPYEALADEERIGG